MSTLCEICRKREYSQLCDFAKGTGIITSVDFQELTSTCDKKMCKQCAVSLWANCEVCPEHAEITLKKLNNIFGDSIGISVDTHFISYKEAKEAISEGKKVSFHHQGKSVPVNQNTRFEDLQWNHFGMVEISWNDIIEGKYSVE